ncbi:MAG: hypothetical protein VX642_00485 [Bdellovibrionota bacterium]|nr:hypothetical protein [Bdellovibrionota bacterium]
MKKYGLVLALFFSLNAAAMLEVKNPELLEAKIRVDSGNFFSLRKECAEILVKENLPKILDQSTQEYSYKFNLDPNQAEQSLRDLDLENDKENSFVGRLEMQLKRPTEESTEKVNVFFTIISLDFMAFQETKEEGFFGPSFTMECAFQSNFLSPQTEGFRELIWLEDEKANKSLSLGIKNH